MIEAILFDLGDTIIDFGVGRREAEILFRQGAKLTFETLRKEGRLGTGAGEIVYAQYFKAHYWLMRRAYAWSIITRRDFSYQDVLMRSAGKLGLKLTEDDVERLARLWYVPFHLASTTDVGVGGMLERFKRAGMRMGIVSNTVVPGHCLDGHLEAEGLLGYFPVRVYSSAVGFRKPHPRIFAMALEKIGLPPEQVLFVGDLLKADMAGAKRAGMRTIWKPARKTFVNGKAPALPRRSAADFVIPRVTHLPEALAHFGWRGAGWGVQNSELRVHNAGVAGE